MFGCLGGIGMQMGNGRPCPPICNNIVTLRHLLITAPAHLQVTWVAGKNKGEMLLFSKEASTLETC